MSDVRVDIAKRVELTEYEQRQLIELITWAINRVEADHPVELLPDFEQRYQATLEIMRHLKDVVLHAKRGVVNCRQCKHAPWNGGTNCPCPDELIVSHGYCWKGELIND